MFADDTVLISCHQDLNRASKSIETDLSVQLQLNAKKTKIMYVHKNIRKRKKG